MKKSLLTFGVIALASLSVAQLQSVAIRSESSWRAGVAIPLSDPNVVRLNALFLKNTIDGEDWFAGVNLQRDFPLNKRFSFTAGYGWSGDFRSFDLSKAGWNVKSGEWGITVGLTYKF